MTQVIFLSPTRLLGDKHEMTLHALQVRQPSMRIWYIYIFSIIFDFIKKIISKFCIQCFIKLSTDRCCIGRQVVGLGKKRRKKKKGKKNKGKKRKVNALIWLFQSLDGSSSQFGAYSSFFIRDLINLAK